MRTAFADEANRSNDSAKRQPKLWRGIVPWEQNRSFRNQDALPFFARAKLCFAGKSQSRHRCITRARSRGTEQSDEAHDPMEKKRNLPDGGDLGQ